MAKHKMGSSPMTVFDPVQFVEWLIWYANERGSKLTPIRIVKFFYLLDLYYARIMGGQTLTGWKWKFVHYGPFCGESLDVIEQARKKAFIEGNRYSSRFDNDTWLFSFVGDEPPEQVLDNLPSYVISEIKRAVELWADDTYGLLNFVYFRTEPMSSAKPGETLDFSLAELSVREKPLEMNKLSKEKLREAKEILNRLKERHREETKRAQQTLEGALYDQAYFEALKSIDETEEDLPSFDGVLNLKP